MPRPRPSQFVHHVPQVAVARDHDVTVAFLAERTPNPDGWAAA